LDIPEASCAAQETARDYTPNESDRHADEPVHSLKRLVKSSLRKRGYKIIRADEPNILEYLLHSLLVRKVLVFVQIGANDGRTADPLFEFVTHHHQKVRGLVIEPVEDYFQELVANYRLYPSITPVNIAIHRTEKEMTIHRVDPAQQRANSRLRKGIASFDPMHHKRSGTPKEVMLAQTVRCMTLHDLLQQYQITELDLLQIDAEGYDAEILRSIDFDALRPSIVRFEHGRLKKMPRQTFLEVQELLRSHGYEMIIEPRDATAYRPEVMFPL